MYRVGSDAKSRVVRSMMRGRERQRARERERERERRLLLLKCPWCRGGGGEDKVAAGPARPQRALRFRFRRAGTEPEPSRPKSGRQLHTRDRETKRKGRTRPKNCCARPCGSALRLSAALFFAALRARGALFLPLAAEPLLRALLRAGERPRRSWVILSLFCCVKAKAAKVQATTGRPPAVGDFGRSRSMRRLGTWWLR